MNFNKLLLSISIMTVTSVGYAGDMSSWLGGGTAAANIGNSAVSESKPQASSAYNYFFSNSAQIEPTDNENTKNSTTAEAQPIQLEDRPQSTIAQLNQQHLNELNEQEAISQANATTTKPIQLISNESSLNNTASYSKEIQQEQKQMENFINQAQKFLSVDTITNLKSQDSIAIGMLNSALLQIGVSIMSGQSSSDDLNTYNQAVGCINSQNSNNLNLAARNLISQYQTIVNITPLVQKGQAVGGSYQTKCY